MFKKKFKKSFCSIIVVSILTLIITSNVFADTVHYNTNQNSLLYYCPEDGFGYIVCSGSSNTRVLETYHKTTEGNIIATNHTNFSWVENWNGDIYGADLYVIANSSMDFYYSSEDNIICSQSLSYDSNVYTDPDWIWDNKTSSEQQGFGYTYMNAKSGTSYYCLDAINPSAFYSVATVMN